MQVNVDQKSQIGALNAFCASYRLVLLPCALLTARTCGDCSRILPPSIRWLLNIVHYIY